MPYENEALCAVHSADDVALLHICGASLLRLKKVKRKLILGGKHTEERLASLRGQIELIRKIEIKK